MRTAQMTKLDFAPFANKHPEAVQQLYKALTGGVDEEGGFTVDTVLSKELLRLAFLDAKIRGLFKQRTMTSDVEQHNLVDGRHSVTWPGENTDGTPSDMTFAQVELIAKKVMAYQEDFSTELEEDSVVDMWQEIATSMSQAIAEELDYQILEGTGAPWTGLKEASGILTLPAVNLNGDKVHPDKIIQAEEKLAEVDQQADVLIVGLRDYSLIKQLKDENKNYLFNKINKDKGILGTGIVGDILGYDVVVSKHVSKNNVVGGSTDASYMILMDSKRAGLFGTRRGMTMRRDYNVKGDKNEVNMTARHAFSVWDPTAICKIDGITPSGT